MNRIKKLFFLTFILVSLNVFGTDPLKTTHKKLSKKETVYLESFFKDLVCFEGLGYTLFFDKPICLSGYFKREPKGNIVKGGYNPLFKLGWYTWKKNEHLFPHPNFIIFSEKIETEELKNYEKQSRQKIELYSIFIINKKNLLFALEKNRDLFQKELGANFSSFELVQKIESERSLLKSINFNEGLLGILLGYGRESSLLYQEREVACKNQKPKDYFLIPIEIESKKPDCFIEPLRFVGDPHSKEVKEIMKQNAVEQEALCHIYSQHHFLEVSIKQLMSANEERVFEN